MPPRGHMVTSGDSCAYHNSGGGVCCRHEWATHTTAPMTEKNPVSNVTSAEAEKP